MTEGGPPPWQHCIPEAALKPDLPKAVKMTPNPALGSASENRGNQYFPHLGVHRPVKSLLLF